jgi:hypothetical protein
MRPRMRGELDARGYMCVAPIGGTPLRLQNMGGGFCRLIRLLGIIGAHGKCNLDFKPKTAVSPKRHPSYNPPEIYRVLVPFTCSDSISTPRNARATKFSRSASKVSEGGAKRTPGQLFIGYGALASPPPWCCLSGLSGGGQRGRSGTHTRAAAIDPAVLHSNSYTTTTHYYITSCSLGPAGPAAACRRPRTGRSSAPSC